MFSNNASGELCSSSSNPATEKHYTIRQLERLTGINYHTLRRRLMRVPDVRNLKTRKNNCFRVPESVWLRVYGKWKNEAGK